jgi:hypothetical protein
MKNEWIRLDFFLNRTRITQIHFQESDLNKNPWIPLKRKSPKL